MDNELNPYGLEFSEVYNLFWKDFVEKLGPKVHELISNKILPNKISKYLDLFCGTGRLLNYFTSKNIQSWGIDSSQNMINITRQRLKKQINSGLVTTIIQDATQFQLDHKFDLITATFDSINHLPNLGQVRSCIQNVKLHLTDYGYFLFDINTEKTLKNWNFFEVEESEDKSIVYFMQGKYENTWNKAYSRVSGFIKSGTENCYKRFDELYYNTIYKIKEISEILEDLNFSSIEFYDDNLTTINTDPEKEDRVFILAKS